MTISKQDQNNNPATILEFSRLQLAAEALYGFKDAKPNFEDSKGVASAGNLIFNYEMKPEDLISGNDHNSKFTPTDAAEFVENWEMVAHIANTTTGFSGSLFRAKKDIEGTRIKAKELVMSFRSTEFVDDDVHDSRSTNTLEIKEKGWAFGQIADMEQWFKILSKENLIDKPLYVTGYSLGGHLATAFNILHRDEVNTRTGGNLIEATYTFNGAGVGLGANGEEITKKDLHAAIEYFKRLKGDGENKKLNEDYVENKFVGEIRINIGKGLGQENSIRYSLAEIYKKVKNWLDLSEYNKEGNATQMGESDNLSKYIENIAIAEKYLNEIVTSTDRLLTTSPENYYSSNIEEIKLLKFLRESVVRVREVANEYERVKTLRGGKDTNSKPHQLPARFVDSLKLDYQLAVVLAANRYTKNFSIVAGAINIDKDLNDNLTVANQGIKDFYNIWAATKPSMVAVSQLHYGAENVLVGIEDQPLVRGNYISLVRDETIREANLRQATSLSDVLSQALDLQLLTSDYGNSNFGDTHSLVLMVDSLSTQKIMEELGGEISIDEFKNIMALASNTKAFVDVDKSSLKWFVRAMIPKRYPKSFAVLSESDVDKLVDSIVEKIADPFDIKTPNKQGYAEGDVLENIINMLAKQLGVKLDVNGKSQLVGDHNGGTWATPEDHYSYDKNGKITHYTGRNSLHAAIKQINEFIKDNNLEDAFTILPATEASAQAAAADFGHFLALKTLSPFVLAKKQGLSADKQAAVEKIWSDAWAQEYLDWQHDLDARQNQNEPAYYTDQWLEDRQILLTIKSFLDITNQPYQNGLIMEQLQKLMEDSVLSKQFPGFGDRFMSILDSLKSISDAESGLAHLNTAPRTIRGADIHLAARLGKTAIQFGSKKDDELTGSQAADHLYGGGGSDTLKGGDGEDHLEGGAGVDHLYGGKGKDYLYGGSGHDYYYFKSDEIDDDVIVDPDEGEIRIDDKPLKGVHVPPSEYGRWRDEDGYTYITLNERSDGKGGMIADLQIVTPQNKRLTWKDWHHQKNEKGLFGSKFKLELKADKETKNTIRYMNGDVVAPFEKDENGKETNRYDWNATHWNYAEGKLVGGIKAPGFNDVLRGTKAQDVIHGLGGNDAIDGSDGNDTLYGDDGHDLITGGKGSDRVFGGKGDDILFGSSYLKGYVKWENTHSNGTLGGGRYTYQNGGVWGRMYPQGSSREHLAGPHIDYMRDETNTEGDYLVGGDGADTIYGSHENDWIYGDEVSRPDYVPDAQASQDDELYGLGGDDHIFGGDGNDSLFGDGHFESDKFGYLPAVFHGNDYLYGGKGQDVLRGQLGSDHLYGGDDADGLIGGLDIDTSEEEDGDAGDYLYGGAGYDLLIGNAGNDYLYGEKDGGKLYGGAGDDFLFSGSQYSYTVSSDDYFSLSDLIDYQIRYGTVPPSYVTTYLYNELYGGSGNDTLVAESGSIMDGGTGNDTYLFDEAAWYAGAQHTILPDASGNDTVRFQTVGFDQIKLAWSEDGVLSLIYGQGVISIQNYSDIEQVIFAGSERISTETLVELAQQQVKVIESLSSEQNTSLRQTGGFGRDTLAAAAETAYLHGGAGADTYVVRKKFRHITVSDFQSDNSDPDRLVLEQLNADDVLFHHFRNDLVISDKATGGKITVAGYFDEQNPGYGVGEISFADHSSFDRQAVLARLSGATEFADNLMVVDPQGGELNGLGGDDRLLGSAGNDILNGGAGNDVLQGGRGSNTYVFEGEFGRDIISNPIVDTNSKRDLRENDYQINKQLLEQNQIDETLQFISLQTEDVSFHRRGKDLLIRVRNSANQVQVERFFASGKYQERYTFSFENGIINGGEIAGLLPRWSHAPQANGELPAQSSRVADEWRYTLPADLFTDLDQDELDYRVTLADGRPLPEWLRFDAANRVLYGTAPYEETLQLLVTVTDPATNQASLPLMLEILPKDLSIPQETMEGSAKDDILQGGAKRDRLNGYGGNDRLYGGAGHDILDGGAGDDWLEGGYDGADTYLFAKGHGQDTVDDLAENNLTGDSDTLRFEGAASSDAVFTRSGNDLVVKAYGGTDQVKVKDYFTDRNRREFRFAFDDQTLESNSLTITYNGTDQDDVIRGSELNEVITGGAGNDMLIGGGERDTYVFAKGHGQDTVDDSTEDRYYSSILRFEGAASSDAVFTRSGNDLLIRAYGGNDQVLVKHFYPEAGDHDHSYWYYEFVFDDRVWGNGYWENWEGFNIANNGTDQDDTIQGIRLNEIIKGGAGNDTLIGGGGEDTYVFAKGHGQDTVVDWSIYMSVPPYRQPELKTLRFEGAAIADAAFDRSGNDLIIRAYGGKDQVTLSGYFKSGAKLSMRRASDEGLSDLGISLFQFIFDDRTLSPEDIHELTITGRGTDRDDKLYGFGGNDILYGAAGNDHLAGYDGEDVLSGGDGDDELFGYDGNDVLDGGSGNDTLEGGIGNDTLIGGSGNDMLVGEMGINTYLFAAGHGQDKVEDYTENDSEADTLRFEGALAADAAFIRRGNDLAVRAYGTEDEVLLPEYFTGYVFSRHRFAFDDRTLLPQDIDGILVVESMPADKDWTGSLGNDTILGGNGNDRLTGGGGSDVFDGGAGNDKLFGNPDSADTYLFARGHGRDEVRDSAETDEQADTLRFAGAHSSNAVFERIGNHLLVRAYGGDDQLALPGYFDRYGDKRYSRFKLTFDDRTLQYDDISGMLTTGINISQTKPLYGTEQDDQLTGGAGNDSLHGNGGRDVLEGGAGDDILIGNYNSADTYLFTRGHGQDRIYDFSENGLDADTLRFEGAHAADAVFSRSGNDLLIQAYGSGDQVGIANYFHSYLADNRYNWFKLAFDDEVIEYFDYEQYAAQANSLTQAMSTFGGNEGSGPDSSTGLPEAVNPLLAASPL